MLDGYEKFKTNSSLISYVTVLQKKSTQQNKYVIHTLINTYNRNINISYDMKNNTSFQSINNKKTKKNYNKL